jgi:hypothetical protein
MDHPSKSKPRSPNGGASRFSPPLRRADLAARRRTSRVGVGNSRRAKRGAAAGTDLINALDKCARIQRES